MKLYLKCFFSFFFRASLLLDVDPERDAPYHTGQISIYCDTLKVYQVSSSDAELQVEERRGLIVGAQGAR